MKAKDGLAMSRLGRPVHLRRLKSGSSGVTEPICPATQLEAKESPRCVNGLSAADYAYGVFRSDERLGQVDFLSLH
jgi:hypothetical protein